MNIILLYSISSLKNCNFFLFLQASDQEDDFITKVGTQKQLHIPPTESNNVEADKAGGEKIKSIEKSKLLVPNLLSDGLCKPKSETTSESSSQKKRKVLKKRVKVALPKISDFKKFLDSKLKVISPELDKDTKTSEPVALSDSILERVEECASVNEESKAAKPRTRRGRELQKASDKNHIDCDKNKKDSLEKLPKLDTSKTGPS